MADTFQPAFQEKIPLLSRSPKSLYDLWDEWIFGIGENKAAKDLSPTERGKVKFKFSRR